MRKAQNTDGGQKHSNSPEIDALLQEHRAFAPAEAFRAQANVRDEKVYEEAARDPEAFWANFARELEWSSPWTKCSTGSRRTPSGSLAARSTRASTASTGISGARDETRRRSSGKASLAIGER